MSSVNTIRSAMKTTNQGNSPYQLICKINSKISCEEVFVSFQLALDKLTKKKEHGKTMFF